MAFLEVGSISNTIVRMIKGEKAVSPLFTRDEPRYAGRPEASTPIRTIPLNVHESEEQDALRSLRTAIGSQ